jgi:hypothetical protein
VPYSRFASISQPILAFMLSLFSRVSVGGASLGAASVSAGAGAGAGIGSPSESLLHLYARCGRVLSLRDLLKWAARVQRFAHVPTVDAESQFLTEAVRVRMCVHDERSLRKHPCLFSS